MFFFAVAITTMTILCILAALPRSKPPVQTYIELTPLELLQRHTFIQACNGNKAARDWTMQNTLRSNNESVELDTAEPECYTPLKEVNDAISALVSLGHTKTQDKETLNK